MPGVKMFAWGPSLQVPLMVRFPKKWQHLAPTAPGGSTDQLVTFVDFAPTVLSLAGVAFPGHFQGSAFLGAKAAPARDRIFGGKDRQGECYDTIRYIRDHRFQYLRNFQPHLPYGQYMSYVWQHESMRVWERLHQEGKLTGAPARFFAARKPVEELYDVRNDPWQVNNLANDPVYAAELVRYRTQLAQEMRTAGDLGLLPEREMHARVGQSTPYVMATDARLNPLDALLRAADQASQRDVRQLGALTELLRAEDSAVRWWGAVGLLALGTEAAPAKAALVAALEDTSPDVRITVAETLAKLGALDRALPVLEAALQHADVYARLAALNTALRLGPAARPLLPAIRQAKLVSPGHKDASDYIGRMVEYLPERLGQ